jgi:glycosyltransferase involved in cell wall biosynthesis
VVAPWQQNLAQIAALPSDVRLTTHIADVNRSSLGRNLWYYLGLPQLANQLQVDLVHLSFPMPVNARAFRCPTVVTLHDLYPYEIPMNFGFPKFVFNRIVLRQCLRAADTITCVSEATRTQLTKYFSREVWRKAVQIYNYAGAAPAPSLQSPISGWTGEPFLLCVAQHRRNKNIPTLIRAFERLLHSGEIHARSKLIVIGIRGPESDKIQQLVTSARLSSSVQLLEGLSEPELQWCYQRCAALVAPSLTEGFGAPVAEGLLAGCRIVCSDIPAHREIGNGQCRFVTLRDNAVGPFAEAIAAALHEPKMPPISLPQLSIAVIAKQYVSLYERLTASASLARNVNEARSINIATSERPSL